jgi:hypothetical protein
MLRHDQCGDWFTDTIGLRANTTAATTSDTTTATTTNATTTTITTTITDNNSNNNLLNLSVFQTIEHLKFYRDIVHLQELPKLEGW